MSFDAAKYLANAIPRSRAKSDVANKLVSMFLHDLSRRISAQLGISVSDTAYTRAVTESFGDSCAYCRRILERDRVAVEHLDGMNRYRVGLHVAGNVVISCKHCNSEKRRDDSLKTLMLAATGWESFLSHDGRRCPPSCKTCNYWKTIWPDDAECMKNLETTLLRIRKFRAAFPNSVTLSARAQKELTPDLDAVYRECQSFATEQISSAVAKAFDRIVIR